MWQGEIEALRLDIRGWLRDMVGSAEAGRWTPRHYELAFGLPSDEQHDASSSEEEAVIRGDRRLRGSIDAVESSADGSPRWRVTDYKTGSYRHKRAHVQVGGGEILQPLLYAMAAERMLDQPVTSGRLYFATRKGGYRELVVPLDEDARDAVVVVLDAVDSGLDAGFLPATPRADACRWCDFRIICGPHEERRQEHKYDDPRLIPLRHARSLP